jgi:putative ABC transport system ATP-binding protein
MILLDNICKVFNENSDSKFLALDNINLNIKAGELVVLKGVSGSGKSTLLSIIGTLERPTSGSVIVDGESVAKLPDIHASAFRSKTIGFIFQSFNLYDDYSVSENISIPLLNQKYSLDEIESKVSKCMKFANIEHKANQIVQTLSGGEKQRVAIARSLVNDPQIILCDEPTANLDKDNSISFINSLKELKELGKTIVVSTHDLLFDDLDFVDRIINIENGKITSG